MSIPVVQNFMTKAGDPAVTAGLKPVKKTLEECLLDLQKYINDTVDEYLGASTYDPKTVSDWIYLDSIDTTDHAKVETYVMVNLFAARNTFNSLVDEINASAGGFTEVNIKRYSELLYDFLHDVNGFINYYRWKTDKTFVFLTGGKSYGTSSFETFMMAKSFFYSSLIANNPLPYKESQGMAAMTIRQSIEIKTKRVLGVGSIEPPPGKSYGFKRLFTFIEQNASDIIYDPIDFEVLKNIYAWSCAYIHNGTGSFIWQTETALRYLQPFFKGGTSTVNGRTTSSVFGGFKLRNFGALKTKLRAFVTPTYTVNFVHDNEVEAIIES